MSKETRTIRPFVGLDELGGLLDQVALRFGRERCGADETLAIDLTPHEFLLSPVSLEWAVDEEAFSQLNERFSRATSAARLRLESLSFVVVATSGFLKIADVLLHHPAADLEQLPRVTALTDPPRCRALSAPFSGFAVSLYLLLTETLAPEPLRPHLKGSWLARTTFTVETSLAAAILPPTPLTKEKREELGLPARVVRYLDFGEHDLLASYRDQERPAGPPCQGHSNLNNHTRRTDPRNRLYLAVPAITLAIGAPVCIIENVPSVLHDSEAVVEVAQQLFEHAGYRVESGSCPSLGWVGRNGESATS